MSKPMPSDAVATLETAKGLAVIAMNFDLAQKIRDIKDAVAGGVIPQIGEKPADDLARKLHDLTQKVDEIDHRTSTHCLSSGDRGRLDQIDERLHAIVKITDEMIFTKGAIEAFKAQLDAIDPRLTTSSPAASPIHRKAPSSDLIGSCCRVIEELGQLVAYLKSEMERAKTTQSNAEGVS